MIPMVRKVLSMLPRSDRWRLLVLLGLMVITALLEVVGIGAIPVFLMAVAAPEKLQALPGLPGLLSVAGIETEGEILLYGTAALALVFLVKNAYQIFYNIISYRFIYRRLEYIANGLFRRYMEAPYEYHLGQNSATLIRYVTQDTIVLIRSILEPGMRLVMGVLMIAGTGAFLLWLEPVLTLAATVFLGLVAWAFTRSIKAKIETHGHMTGIARKEMIQAVQEGLGGFKDIRALGRQSWFTDRFDRAVARLAETMTFSDAATTSVKPVIETFAMVGLLLITVGLYVQGKEPSDILPVLTLFGVAAMRLMPTLNLVVASYNSLRYNNYAVESMYQEVRASAAPAPAEAAGAAPLTLNDAIVFDGVSYAYPGAARESILDLSLRIGRGQVVGFVGSSGAGKTTLIDLLLGLLNPRKGAIRVDGRDIRESLPSWRERIGYVPQFIFLTDASLRDNIAFGVPPEQIDPTKIERAMRAAQLEDFVRELPQGLDTMVGERGVRLSGGQRQRIAIARALYHQPSVLVLDEATSALDNATERYVMQAVEGLRGELTIIMIAHRLTTVRNSDNLFLLDQGKLIQQGTYDALWESSAVFKKMADA